MTQEMAEGKFAEIEVYARSLGYRWNHSKLTWEHPSGAQLALHVAEEQDMETNRQVLRVMATPKVE